MNVRWLKRALKSLEKNVIYSREEFGQKHAEEFLEKVDVAVKRIQHQPSASPLLLGLNIPNREFRYLTLYKNIILVYEVRTDVCCIYGIWDTRQNPTKLCKFLNIH